MFPRASVVEVQENILGKSIASDTRQYITLFIPFLSSASTSNYLDGRRDEHSITCAAAASRSATTAHPRRQPFLEPHRHPKIPRARTAPPIHISDPPAPFTMPILAMHPDPLEPRALAAPRLPRLDRIAGHERPLPDSGRGEICFCR